VLQFSGCVLKAEVFTGLEPCPEMQEILLEGDEPCLRTTLHHPHQLQNSQQQEVATLQQAVATRQQELRVHRDLSANRLLIQLPVSQSPKHLGVPREAEQLWRVRLEPRPEMQ
jgi:hypothetical protein